MATKSFYEDMIIDTPEALANFIRACEKSKKNPVKHKPSNAVFNDPDVISRIGKTNGLTPMPQATNTPTRESADGVYDESEEPFELHDSELTVKSFYEDMIIDTPEAVENLIRAYERSKKNPYIHQPSKAIFNDPEVILRIGRTYGLTPISKTEDAPADEGASNEGSNGNH